MLIHDAFYQVVKKETSGNFEYGLLTILKCSENPAKYFAKVSDLTICKYFCSVIHVPLFMLNGRMDIFSQCLERDTFERMLS